MTQTKQHEESAYDYLVRIVQALEYESGNIVDSLPSPQSIVEYFELWGKYDTELMDGIIKEIDAGADPKPLHEFIEKYFLLWAKHTKENNND